tara:strand:+ start:54 stop:503 length:450 start_codon:yes stop_codon:yes gene_type:complete
MNKGKKQKILSGLNEFIAETINILHLIFLFIPFVLVLIPSKYLVNVTLSIQLIALVYLFVPLHWIFFDNRCFVTVFSLSLGDYQNNKNSDSAFTEENLQPIYEPIMNKIGLDWNKSFDLEKMINLHWMAIFVCLWVVISFKLCNVCKIR